MSKICTNCGNIVQDDSKFCPNCGSENFKNQYEVAPANPSYVHKLFYWNYNGKYVLSKSKVSSVIVFLLFSIVAMLSGAPGGILFFAVIFAILTYVLGFAIHQIIGPPSQEYINHNDYGLLEDLKHLFFFWQNKQGEYVLSKTKIVSHFIFLIFFIYAMYQPNLVLISKIAFAVILETPAFILGYAIHKVINPNPQAPKPVENKNIVVKEIPKVKPQIQGSVKNTIPEYNYYKQQLDKLQLRFKAKEASARDMIEKRFEPPQLTYTRFIGGVDKSHELFFKQLESAYTIIDIADEYSPRIEDELKSKIEILDSINDKMDDLINELIISDDVSKKDDIDNVINEMDELIKSIKDYE